MVCLMMMTMIRHDDDDDDDGVGDACCWIECGVPVVCEVCSASMGAGVVAWLLVHEQGAGGSAGGWWECGMGVSARSVGVGGAGDPAGMASTSKCSHKKWCV